MEFSLLHDIETNAFERQKRRVLLGSYENTAGSMPSAESALTPPTKQTSPDALRISRSAAVQLGSDQPALGVSVPEYQYPGDKDLLF